MRGTIICRSCGRSIHKDSPKCGGKHGGPFAVAVYQGIVDGRQKYQWTGGFETVKDAEARLLEIATSPAYGSGLGPRGSSRQRVGDEMEAWLERANCGEGERASRRSRFKLHIRPYVGHVPLMKVAPETVEGLLGRMTALSPTMRRKVYEDLRMFFDDAMRKRWITANPCDGVDKPPRARYIPPVAHWSRDHVRAFFVACGEAGDDGLLFLTAYYSSARQGEVLGLTWDHVDLDERAPTLTFVQDLARRKGGGAEFDQTKTETSNRTVLMPASLTRSLRALRRRQVEERVRRGPCGKGHACRYQHCRQWHEWGLVFAQLNGKPLIGRDVTQRTLKRLCERAGVPPVRFYDLRHLNISVQMRGNVNAGIIKSRAGHSSAAFTIDRYGWASLDREEQKVAVEALERGTR